MQISEASVASGLSVDTIRYYEKSGMLPAIHRGQNGQRRFTASDIEWLTLLYWLRETGMAMKQMRRFTILAKAGRNTIPERRAILQEHAEELKRRRNIIDKCELVLARKIESYRSGTGSR